MSLPVFRFITCLSLFLGGWQSVHAAPSPAPSYAIIVSRQTLADPAWQSVVEALRLKYPSTILTYGQSVTEVAGKLRELFPRHACFVATPAEASRELVATIHQLTRKLDDDPYADCIWGILTGYNAANALSIARHQAPLTVRKVASGTEVALEKCEQGIWYCELNRGRRVTKPKGGSAVTDKGPDDTTEALVNALNEYHADCFITSGHATERDWQIGFRYRNGYFRCQDGVLYGLDTQKHRFPVQSPNPKVYLPIGNCLMGHVDGTNAMALAYLNSAGVMQMMGYTVTSWYGYAGWGCLDYFIEQPGRHSFAEAFFANQAALIHRLQTCFPGLTDARQEANGQLSAPVKPSPEAEAMHLNANDARGLVYDRDTVAFYGDPAWVARMAGGDLNWEQSLKETNGTWTFEIKPKKGEKTFAPVNQNGSQRGGRPILQYLPHRIKAATLVEGVGLHPVITDDFILVPIPEAPAANGIYRLVFKAQPR
jgi:zinc protease